MRFLPEFARAALAGELGVAQMHTIAGVASNPRVRDHLAGADELFTAAARDLDHTDLCTLLQHWETLADTDGAKARHDRAVRDRRASVHFAGERSFLEAAGPAYDGVIFDEVLQHFTDLEWQTEWDILAAIHGDAMHAGLMERTHSQRCFDALQRIFATAAAGTDGTGPAVTVEIVIDQDTFEHQLDTMLGGHPDPIPPSHAVRRQCEDRQGRVLDPRAVVAATLVGQVRRKVINGEGVVLNLGRRQRLFTGPLRDAVLATARHCTHKGCLVPGHRCEADHLIPYSARGPTNADNGGPGCNHHNRWKNNGSRTLRDAKGLWHTYRPDGTEIGWPTIHTTLEHANVALFAHGP
jgi:hypothetical protein